MRRAGRTARFARILTLSSCLTLVTGLSTRAAAPAAPSYQAVTKTIEKIRTEWAVPNGPAQPNAPGWNALFDNLVGDLRAYSAGMSENDRLFALNRIYQVSAALGAVSWGPAAELRESLREWLRPRVRIAWAERRLVERIQALPGGPAPDVEGNRQKWVRFVENDLGRALRKYDGSGTVGERQSALKGVYAALNALQSRNQTYPWNPAVELQTALNDLYNLPNLDVSADVNTLSPLFNVNLVTSGPVFRRGYWSQVTAGPKTGFGLLYSDDGIGFYNKQLLTSVTPITDFQQQVQSRDPRGERLVKIYSVGATSTDTQELTIYTYIRTSGLDLIPAFAHNFALNISTTPQPGKGLVRAVASLVGFSQPKITQLIWQGAYGQAYQGTIDEAAAMGQERTTAEASQRNGDIRRYLIGNNRLAFKNILIDNLSLRSRPENALIGGTILLKDVADQVGADAPQPTTLLAPDSGISADLHLGSILSNFTRGYLQSEAAKRVENLMVVTRKVAPDAPPASGVKVTQNTDFPTFLKAVDELQAANDPTSVALRVQRPSRSPEFAADSRGDLVALVHDFQVEVPAPKQAAGGGLSGPPARIYRISAPEAEFSISFKVDTPAQGQPLRFTGRVEGFDAGPGAKVYAINDDEAKAQPLNNFTSALILGVLRSKIQGQPIDVPLNNVKLPGFAIRSVSPLDPTGWIRVVLDRNGEPIPPVGQ